MHPKFRLNGISYSMETLKLFGSELLTKGSAFEIGIGSFLLDWTDDQPTVKVKTSGSTGKPKPIVLKKQHMVNSALATGSYFDLKEGNTALLCLSADYIAGKMMLVRALVLGLELDYVEPTSSPLKELSKNYDFAAMVPLQLKESLGTIEKIKTLIVGGTSVSKKLKESVQNTNTAIFETYGMTETITHVAVKKTNKINKDCATLFTAISGVTFTVDARDCLVINAPNVSENQVVTNDVVKLESNKTFQLIGRFDTVINSGGVKLFPKQIEAKLVALISNRFFVAGAADEKLGQRLILVIEGEIDTNKLINTIYEHKDLGKFEVPKNVYTIPKFLVTETGKIRRKEILRHIK